MEFSGKCRIVSGSQEDDEPASGGRIPRYAPLRESKGCKLKALQPFFILSTPLCTPCTHVKERFSLFTNKYTTNFLVIQLNR